MPSQTLMDLLAAAKKKRGSFGVIADEMGLHQSAFSAWKKDKHHPSASQIAFLAECAGWPVLETVAQVESELETRFASVWAGALGKLRAAGVAATTVMAVILTSSYVEPVHASPVTDPHGRSLFLMSTAARRRLSRILAPVNRLRGWVKYATSRPKFSPC